jgi:hypothetical protein
VKNITALPNRKPTTVKDKLAFLKGHFRYYTTNSWNRLHSYAVNIKVSRLNLTHEQSGACYDMLSSDDAMRGFRDCLELLEIETDYTFQIGINGRSDGYAVLYTGGRKPTDHKSYCTTCGQQNWTSVTETGTRCGHCGGMTREDYKEPHMVPYTKTTGLDQNADWGDKEYWDANRIRARFDEVWAFDKCVESACRAFVEFATTHKLVEKTIMVPEKVMVAEEI